MSKLSKYGLLLFAACLLLFACKREEPSECRQIRLSLSETAVKTALNPARTALQWSEGDAISVYNNYDASIAGATYAAGEAISVFVPVDATQVKATYPETSGSYDAPGFVFPEVQEQPAAGVLNGSCYPLVAEAAIVADAAELHFASVGSAFALNVYKPKEQGEKLQYVTVKPSQREQAVKVQMAEPFALGADQPTDKRTYEGQVYACLEKGQYNGIAFTVVTDRYQYNITSNDTMMDLESHDFFVVNLDLAHLKAYISVGVGSENFSEEEEHLVDVTLPGAGFVELTQYYFSDAQLTEDIIPDFSAVGYHWGEAEFPDYGRVVELDAPSGDDDTDMIQAAIDAASEKTVILFQPGRYIVDGLLILDKNGIILRGSGNRQTEIFARGTLTLDEVDPTADGASYSCVRPLINVGVSKLNTDNTRTAQATYSIAAITVQNLSGRIIENHADAWKIRGVKMYSGSTEVVGGGSAIIEDAFCGSNFVTVRDASGFGVGDKVVVYRPGTQEWIHALKMDNIIKALDDVGSIYQWSPEDYSMYWERTVRAVVANRIYFDAPLVMSVTQEFGGGAVRHYARTRIRECGIENLKLTSDYNPDRNSEKYGVGDIYHATDAIVFYGAEHCWVKNVETHRFSNSAVNLGREAKNITVQDCDQREPAAYKMGGLRYAFHISGGQQCLVRNCTTDEDRHQFVTGSKIPGPNVFSRCTSTNGLSDVGPHQRWATGTLYDNISTNTSMKAIDAGNSGTGQGWQGTNQVFWCCTAKGFAAQSPWVTGKNYVIGCSLIGGSPVTTFAKARNYPNPGYDPDGNIVNDSAVNGTRIDGELRALEPGEEQSLYEAQLRDRLASGLRISDMAL